MSSLVPLDGKLSKYTNVVKGWQNRYFILNPQQGVLEYHISQTEAYGSHHKPRGAVLLAGAVIAPSIEDEYTFSVNATNGEVYKLRASSTRERQEWVSRLRAVSQHFTSQIAQEHPPLYSSSIRKPRASSTNSNTGPSHGKSKGHTKQKHANTPSTNGPAFGGMIGDSNTQDSHKTTHGGKKSKENRKFQNTADIKELQEAREVLVTADNYHAGVITMLESLKYPIQHHGGNTDTTSLTSNEDEPSDSSLALDRDVLLLKSTSTAMLRSLNNCYTLLQKYNQHMSAALPSASKLRMQPAPDAEIVWVEPRTDFKLSPALQHKSTEKDSHSIASFEAPSLADPNDEVKDSKLTHEDDLGPVDEHKNVIMHLLSQLKLGMDLTKVTLPTFILERRSLLEMYADFIGHAHLFTSIPDGKTEEERLCKVFKFYVSSFHSGRRGQIAKKPYNPIVGEVFQCSYYVPKDDTIDESVSPSAVTHHRVKFISEQVSHHPPVSAFYVSCPDKEVTLNSHIWTKSKFMNMSIGVSNVGEGVLSLPSLNEDYVMTYPSAFARSILTVPWSELGGRCSITCQKTGMTCNITFHTKPMYGGQPHRITAEMKNTNGFIFCRADGKWNGEIELTYYKSSDTNDGAGIRGRTETIDLRKLEILSKYVRPFEAQNRMESRKLWCHVTKSLSCGNISSATKHKTELENQQREVEKQRQDENLPVPTAYFTHSKGKDFDIYTHKPFLK